MCAQTLCVWRGECWGSDGLQLFVQAQTLIRPCDLRKRQAWDKDKDEHSLGQNKATGQGSMEGRTQIKGSQIVFDQAPLQYYIQELAQQNIISNGKNIVHYWSEARILLLVYHCPPFPVPVMAMVVLALAGGYKRNAGLSDCLLQMIFKNHGGSSSPPGSDVSLPLAIWGFVSLVPWRACLKMLFPLHLQCTFIAVVLKCFPED